MTEREFEQLRRSYAPGSDSQRKDSATYFSFFKLRCLLCLILLLAGILSDRQIDLGSRVKVQQFFSLLEKEEITVEECLQVLQ